MAIDILSCCYCVTYKRQWSAMGSFTDVGHRVKQTCDIFPETLRNKIAHGLIKSQKINMLRKQIMKLWCKSIVK